MIFGSEGGATSDSLAGEAAQTECSMPMELMKDLGIGCQPDTSIRSNPLYFSQCMPR